MHSGRWILLAALWPGLALAGCGDDSSPSDDGGTDDQGDVREDGGADADADVPAEADAETVADADGDGGPSTLRLTVQDGNTEVPLGEVQVLVQTAAGGDQWLVTDALGVVTIDDVDLAGDPPTISFFKEGYAFVTYVKVDRPLTDPITLPSMTDADTIHVSGTVTGLTGTERGAAGVWNGAGWFQKDWTDAANAYGVDIQVGTTADGWDEIAGQVFGADLTTGALGNWVRGSTPYACAAAPCSDATLDFALPTPATPMSHASVTLAYPTGSDAFPAPAFVPAADNVTVVFEMIAANETDGAVIGTGEAVGASATPLGLSLDLGWVTDLGGFTAADVTSTFSAPGNRNYDVFAEMRVAGLPTEGQVVDVLAPAVFTTPPDLATAFSLIDDTAVWVNPDWATYNVLWLYSNDLQTLRWLVILPISETSFHFPDWPDSYPAMPLPMRLGINSQGYLDAPASVWELFNLGTSFTGTSLGYVYDLRHRVTM
jgi:hypothetical protein